MFTIPKSDLSLAYSLSLSLFSDKNFAQKIN